MKIGTKTVLAGAHCFFLHPFFLAKAWWDLYGFPWDPRLWVAFAVHDLGYWGKPNLDGREGTQHPELGAKIMHFLFDWQGSWDWYKFTKYHSRFLAKKDGEQYSKLCVADKWACVITPPKLYLFCVRLTGEIDEYRENVRKGKYQTEIVDGRDDEEWLENMRIRIAAWVKEHKEIKEDTWTKVQ